MLLLHEDTGALLGRNTHSALQEVARGALASWVAFVGAVEGKEVVESTAGAWALAGALVKLHVGWARFSCNKKWSVFKKQV